MIAALRRYSVLSTQSLRLRTLSRRASSAAQCPVEFALVAPGPARYSPARRLLCHVRDCGVICWGADKKHRKGAERLPERRVHLGSRTSRFVSISVNASTGCGSHLLHCGLSQPRPTAFRWSTSFFDVGRAGRLPYLPRAGETPAPRGTPRRAFPTARAGGTPAPQGRRGVR
jgi:hypothetical protein